MDGLFYYKMSLLYLVIFSCSIFSDISIATCCDFVKLIHTHTHTVIRALGVTVSQSSIEDHKENCNRKIYYSQVLEEVHNMSWGSVQGGQGRV